MNEIRKAKKKITESAYRPESIIYHMLIEGWMASMANLVACAAWNVANLSIYKNCNLIQVVLYSLLSSMSMDPKTWLSVKKVRISVIPQPLETHNFLGGYKIFMLPLITHPEFWQLILDLKTVSQIMSHLGILQSIWWCGGRPLSQDWKTRWCRRTQ